MTVGAQIGEGGMGVVFEATGKDREGKTLELVVKAPQPGDANQLALRREYAAHAKVRPGEVELVRGDDGTLLLVMPAVLKDGPGSGRAPTLYNHLFGGSDDRYSSDPSKRDVAHIDRFALDLVDDLVHVHELGLVHSDIKNTNVLVGKKPKLIDFGLAVEKGYVDPDGFTRGTMGLMNRDALTAEQANERIDVYAMQRTLEEIYFRDWRAKLDGPNATNFLVRDFPYVTSWREMLFTPDDGSDGVKPEIAWVLHSAAFKTSKEFRSFLEKAQKSTSTKDFLAEYRRLWQAAWKGAPDPDREDLLMELLRKKTLGKSFFEGLDADVRTAVLKRAKKYNDTIDAHPNLRYPFGAHPAIRADWLLALAPPSSP